MWHMLQRRQCDDANNGQTVTACRHQMTRVAVGEHAGKRNSNYRKHADAAKGKRGLHSAKILFDEIGNGLQ